MKNEILAGIIAEYEKTKEGKKMEVKKTVKEIIGGSRHLNFDDAERITENTTFKLISFDIIYSKKYECLCALIESEDRIYSTWGRVIIGKLKELGELDPVEWQNMMLKTVTKTAKNGREYLDFETV